MSKAATISPEFLQSVLAAAEQSGLMVPQGVGDLSAPTMRMEWGWRRIGIELGGILRGKNIFLRGGISGEMVSVDERTGKTLVFNHRNFASWVDEFVAFSFKGERIHLQAEHAAMITQAWAFRAQLREIEGVHLMRLPVRRTDGRVEWLGHGYDEGTKIFTCDLLQYDHDWTLERARAWLLDHLRDFPWQYAEEDKERDPETNRSYAVQIAAMLGIYCRAMFPAECSRPMMAWIANQPGTGKSTLALMAGCAVFGVFGGNKTPKDDETMDKELDAAAQAMAPILFLDDVGHAIFSPPLNRFVTEARHSGRVLGSKERFDVPAVTQVFVTGNDVKTSSDLRRRAMIIELFLAGDVQGRRFAKLITKGYLAKEEVRAGFLSAMAALVRHWLAAPEAARASLDAMPAMESFEEFTSTLAQVVVWAGYTNPLSAPLMPVDEDEDEMRLLLIAIATEAEGNKQLDRHEVIEAAWRHELCEDLFGVRTEKELDAKINKRIGRRLQKWRGRELTDGKGRRFRFAYRRQKTGAKYPLTFIE